MKPLKPLTPEQLRKVRELAMRLRNTYQTPTKELTPEKEEEIRKQAQEAMKARKMKKP